MDKIIKFDATLCKAIYNTPEYRIYAVYVNNFLYPRVFINRYGNTIISGKNIYELSPDIVYHITATEIVNAKYGKQYQVLSIQQDKPVTLEAQKTFLQTILTERQSQSILDQYPNFVDLISSGKADEIDLSKLKFIKRATFNKIVDKIDANFSYLDLCETFQNILDWKTLKQLKAYFGSSERAKEALQTMPYKSLVQISGVGFKTADELILKLENKIIEAKVNKVPVEFDFNRNIKDSDERCRACMEYFLGESVRDSGNTLIGVNELKTKVRAYAPETLAYFDDLLKDTETFYYDVDKGLVAGRIYYNTEAYIASVVSGEPGNQQTSFLSNDTFEKWDFDLTPFSKVQNFELTEKQRSIQKLVCDNKIAVLIGFSGSGKSTSVNAIIQMCRANNISFILGAPTAKAAKVLSRACTSPENGLITATTVHRLLGYQNGEWLYNENNPISEKLVIIDESSMLDIFLFSDLLKAINFNKTHLLLVGDYAQIASVGAGNVLYDLCMSKFVPTVFLDQIFRYGEDGLTTVCTKIRKCEPVLPQIENEKMYKCGKSYAFMQIDSDHIVEKCVNMYKMLLKNNSITDLMVLSAYNKGNYGTVVLNNAIQQAINPTGESVVVKKDDTEIIFRVNDLVTQCVNNYKSVVCEADGTTDEHYPDGVLIANGENGRILKIINKGLVIQFDDYLIYKSQDELSELRLGYVYSIHASQGSQAKITLLLTPSNHNFFLNSNLLYVAISRSTDFCLHLGDASTVNKCTKKKMELRRKTLLPIILRQKVLDKRLEE